MDHLGVVLISIEKHSKVLPQHSAIFPVPVVELVLRPHQVLLPQLAVVHVHVVVQRAGLRWDQVTAADALANEATQQERTTCTCSGHPQTKRFFND